MSIRIVSEHGRTHPDRVVNITIDKEMYDKHDNIGCMIADATHREELRNMYAGLEAPAFLRNPSPLFTGWDIRVGNEFLVKEPMLGLIVTATILINSFGGIKYRCKTGEHVVPYDVFDRSIRAGAMYT